MVARESYETNVDFEGLSLQELTDPLMHNWVHHVQYILPQGRCTWFNSFEKPEDDFEDEDLDDEDEEETDEATPETGPPLLATVAGDAGRLINLFTIIAAKTTVYTKVNILVYVI